MSQFEGDQEKVRMMSLLAVRGRTLSLARCIWSVYPFSMFRRDSRSIPCAHNTLLQPNTSPRDRHESLPNMPIHDRHGGGSPSLKHRGILRWKCADTGDRGKPEVCWKAANMVSSR